MRLHKYNDDKEYVRIQTEGNERKIDIPLGDGKIKKKALIISGKKIGGGSK